MIKKCLKCGKEFDAKRERRSFGLQRRSNYKIFWGG